MKVTIMDFTPQHHPNLGIDHSNITRFLNRANWKRKAVVRDGNYLMIHRGRFDKNNQTHIIFDIIGLPEKKSKQFGNIDEAIEFVDHYSDNEGQYPKEHNGTWTIMVPIK